ncbi:P-loop ATPase, Sll1717 family [Pseudomonas sp. LP_7_YM]|uniref:P-loop ATPase, Sll1717 family n=1 Tax=Pseudomonas sp. LP_7_YM TaxID=2485137 RepID=UPI00105E3B25|nr:hypothetical protein [Pseudomonas sp. LP_7_YM]TDV64561.1 hypothetical protein EC915_105267 [Pseudomonas sp. LP_7_YM]
MLTKKDLLKSLRVGHRVAEDEKNELGNYFVKTAQWEKLENGEIDVIYGAKGMGKSALYSLLSNSSDDFAAKNILLIPAENPLGASVFQTLLDDGIYNEVALSYMWKLYLLQLIATKLRSSGAASDIATKLVLSLETAGLLPKSFTLESLFNRAKNYIQSFAENEPTEVEYTLGLDSDSGMPNATKKSKYAKTDPKAKLSSVPVNDLLRFANEGLGEASLKVWLLFDRLDVSFSSSFALEKSALRALFKVYSDLKPLDNIKAKIFVRKDIWNRIMEGGFREASHVIKADTIEWNRDGLLNLVVHRLVNNQTLVDYLQLDKVAILSDLAKQEALIELIFPDKVDTGKNPKSFDWMVSRVQDGTEQTAPREVIHMLESLINTQIRKLEQGGVEPESKNLFERSVFKASLAIVSKVRYEQTLCAEYPELKKYTDLLKGGKTEQAIVNLAKTWDESLEQAQLTADKLVATGFFETRTEKDGITYWVPFLYRDALELVQGRAQ